MELKIMANNIKIVLPSVTTRILRLAYRISRQAAFKQVLDLTVGAVEVRLVPGMGLNEKLPPHYSTFHCPFTLNMALRRCYMALSLKEYFERSRQSLRRQIALCHHYKRPQDKKAVLVLHLGPRENKDFQEAKKILLDLFREYLPLAWKNNVHITVETEYPYTIGWGQWPGANFDFLQDLIETFNGESIKNTRQPIGERLGLTFDFSHVFITVKRNWPAMHAFLARFAPVIDYMHVNFPTFRDRKRPLREKPLPARLGFWRGVRHELACPDAHRGIVGLPESAAFDDFMVSAFRKTNIKTTGVVNLEIFWRWFFLYRFRSKGARPEEMYASIKHIEKLVSQAQ